MVEEIFRFTRSEMRQNEEFLVKAHSILHHFAEKKNQFKSGETHQNLRFWLKSDLTLNLRQKCLKNVTL